MNHLASLLLLTAASIPAADLEPFHIATSLASKPYYVGQAIQVKVQIDPDPGADAIRAPRVSGAELLVLPYDGSRAGEYLFLLVPKRGGTVDLSPFRVRSGARSGASRPSRIVVSTVPSEGRDSAFLGGVGAFEVRSEAEPSGVRPGQTLEFRVIISGLAAVGSVRMPDLGGWESPTLRIDPVDDRFQLGETPSRTFRYRIRPTRAGPVVLPQVAVSAFDPTTLRYATKRTSSLAIRVEEPPRFDLGRLDYGPIGRTPTASSRAWVALFGVVSGLGLAAWFFARRRRGPRRVDPMALASSLSRGLVPGQDSVQEARAVAESLTTFLHRVAERPVGILTPLEAKKWFAMVAGDEPMAYRAERLVTRCDRARFGSSDVEAADICDEGRQFFDDLTILLAEQSVGKK